MRTSRKTTVLIAACCAAVVAMGLAASSALAADPGCNGNGWPRGIYNSAGELDTFELNLSSYKYGAVVGMTGSATICGAETTEGLYYVSAEVLYPEFESYGPKTTCGLPDEMVTVNKCDRDDDGTVEFDENMADGAYIGESTSDNYCAGGPCLGFSFGNSRVNTYVDHDIASCSGSGIVACESASSLIYDYNGDGEYTPEDNDVQCGADMLVRESGSSYRLIFGKPTCSGLAISGDDWSDSDIYLTNIDQFTICAFAGDVDGDECGASGTPVNINGGNRMAHGLNEPYIFAGVATMNDGTYVVAYAEHTVSEPLTYTLCNATCLSWWIDHYFGDRILTHSSKGPRDGKLGDNDKKQEESLTGKIDSGSQGKPRR